MKLEVVLVHCNFVANDYQQDSSILYTLIANKPFGSFLEVSPKSHIFLKTLNPEFQDFKEWFKNQNGQPLETEDRMNLTLVIKLYSYYKNDTLGKNLSNK